MVIDWTECWKIRDLIYKMLLYFILFFDPTIIGNNCVVFPKKFEAKKVLIGTYLRTLKRS